MPLQAALFLNSLTFTQFEAQIADFLIFILNDSEEGAKEAKKPPIA